MPLKNPFKWDHRPPKIVGRQVTVLKVEHSIVQRYWVLGDKVWGRNVHWMGKVSGFCTMETSCPRCKKQIPKKWMSWLHVCLPGNQREEGFLELTELAASNFWSQVLEKQTIRGLVILVQRERRTNRSPIKIEVIAQAEIPEGFPRPADPTPTLMRLWRVGD
jgi:hypothetical protein